jgi:hypothetical protein
MSDSSRVTELDLVVGSMITVRPEEDREAYDEERETIADVQDQLREEGINIDLLAQPGVEVWEGGIDTLGELYQLSRLATRLENGSPIDDVLSDGPVIGDDLDRTVTDVWDELRPTRFPHLVNLQGINSYYLPVEFAQPVRLPFEDEEGEQDEAFFGSSSLLLRELTEVEELLRQHNVSATVGAYRCLQTLREAALQSTRHSLPVIIW